MGYGNGYIGHSMSVNAYEAYQTGSKPKSKWTKSEIIAKIKDCFIPEDQDKAVPFESWNLAQLKTLLGRDGWHHTSGAYNKTDFYEIDEDKVNRAIENKYSKPVIEKYIETFQPGYVHGTYREVEYHPYSSHNKYHETIIPFINGRVKGAYVFFENGKRKALQNVSIEKTTKIRKAKKLGGN